MLMCQEQEYVFIPKLFGMKHATKKGEGLCDIFADFLKKKT